MKPTTAIFASLSLIFVLLSGVLIYYVRNENSSDDSSIIFNIEYDTSFTNVSTPSNSKTTIVTTKKNKKDKKSKKNAFVKKEKNEKVFLESEYISFPIDLNSADSSQLASIPGIGYKLAENIIKRREEIGEFRNRYQLLEVDGIGKSKLYSIWDYLFIDNEVFEESSDFDDNEEINVTEKYESDTHINESESETVEPLNINDAKFYDLMKIPDMTEEIAYSILELRSKIGSFSDIYELMYSDEITKENFVKFEKYLTVD